MFPMKKTTILILTIMSISIYSCNQAKKEQSTKHDNDFQFLTEQFADVRIMRYQIPGFEDLSLEQKKFIYYLGEAALAGRDIVYDQNFKYNLSIRRTLEEILKNYEGALESFGAQIKEKDFATDQSLYFYLPDRGDGNEIYGKISAYDSGTYTIHFLLPNKNKENK